MYRALQRINEMHLYVTNRCNMHCTYCSDCPETKQNNRALKFDNMSEEIAVQFIDLILANSKLRRILIVFHGGEPTLQSVYWYAEVINHIKLQAERNKKVIELAMQSNCLSLSDEYLDLFREYDIKVGTSLDGFPELNNKTRQNGEQALQNILKIKKLGILGGVIAIINKNNCNYIRPMLDFFESHNLMNVCFNILYCVGSGKNLNPLDELEIFNLYREIYIYLNETKGERVIERNVIFMLRKFLQPLTSSEHLLHLSCYSPFCHAGITNIICDMSGNLFPCGCSDIDVYKLGSIFDLNDDAATNALLHLHHKNSKYEKICSFCEANTICSFGCPAFSNEDKATESHRCKATKEFYLFLRAEQKSRISEILANSKYFLSDH